MATISSKGKAHFQLVEQLSPKWFVCVWVGFEKQLFALQGWIFTLISGHKFEYSDYAAKPLILSVARSKKRTDNLGDILRLWSIFRE